jgi:thymidylate synthase (FAD)
MDSHAQKEIRDYANVIGYEIVAKLFPHCWEAFVDYRLNAMTLHGQEIATVARAMLNWDGDICPVPDQSHWNRFIPDEWKLPRCRERDEFFVKLVRLGLMQAGTV